MRAANEMTEFYLARRPLWACQSLASQLELCNNHGTAKIGFPVMCEGKGGELIMGKKFVLLSGISLFALTLTLAGCGKKEEPAPPPPPPAPAQEAPAPAEPAAPAGEAAAPTGGEQKAGEQPAAEPEKKEEGAKTK